MKNKYSAFLFNSGFFLMLLLIDQMSKYYIINNFAPGQTNAIIKGIFHFTYIKNPGLALGIFSGKFGLILGLQALVLVVLYIIKKLYFSSNIIINFSFILIYSGAVGNIIDRLVHGFVVDFIDIQVWPVFNLADSYIVVGVIALILYLYIYEDE
ncbi:MAG: signal peptidase II [Bacillota bacterium]